MLPGFRVRRPCPSPPPALFALVSLSAKIEVNTGGMCCAMCTGTRDKAEDKVPSMLESTCVAPVELPTAITRGGATEDGRYEKASLA
jgi:hypothetical protein